MNGEIPTISAGAVMAGQLRAIADQLAAIGAKLRNEIPAGAPTLTTAPTEAATVESATPDSNTIQPAKVEGWGPTCATCGDLMRRAGSCYCCNTCGNTSGCS